VQRARAAEGGAVTAAGLHRPLASDTLENVGESQPTATEEGVPTRLGDYEILGRLAAGGMAEVFVGRLRRLESFERFVVIKRILAHLAHDQEFVDMFLAEARIAAQLVHPNIVQVFDVGCEGGSYFYAMEYIHGEDLRTLAKAASVAGEPIPLEIAVAVGRALASALHHAHTHAGPDGRVLGIVHRDVSPTNVIVGYDGSIKLLDFGVAKIMAQTSVTRAGVRKGKLSYMSPEQCKGNPVDPRSDLFSLGIVLYELTTMRRLFDVADEFAAMYRITAENVPKPSEHRPGYPEELESIVLRALRRDRRLRYQTAAELLEDLESFARGHGALASASDVSAYVTGLMGQRPLPWTDPGLRAATDEVVVAEKEPRARSRARRLALTVAALVCVGAVVGIGAAIMPGEESSAPSGGVPSEQGTLMAAPADQAGEEAVHPRATSEGAGRTDSGRTDGSDRTAAEQTAATGATSTEPAADKPARKKPHRGKRRKKHKTDSDRTERERLDAFLPGQ